MKTTHTITGYRASVSNWFRNFVIQVDVVNNRWIQTQTWFAVFRFKQSTSLPKLDYVLVFRALYAKCEPCDMKTQEDNPNAFYQVSLVHHKTRRIIVHESKNASEAFAKANELSHNFSLRIRDSATTYGKSRWLPQTPIVNYPE